MTIVKLAALILCEVEQLQVDNIIGLRAPI